VNEFKEKFTGYLRSSAPLIGINTLETERCTIELQNVIREWNQQIPRTNASEYLKLNGYDVWKWDINNGWVDFSKKLTITETTKKTQSPVTGTDLRQFIAPRVCLKFPLNSEISGAGIYIMENFDLLWNEASLRPVVIADLLEIARRKVPHHHVVMVGSMTEIPVEVAYLFGWVDFSLPSREELYEVTKKYDTVLKNNPLSDGNRGAIADAAAGLTLYEAEQILKTAIIKDEGKSIDIQFILNEKSKSVRKSGLLDYMEVEDTIADVGGLTNLKMWIERVANVFHNYKKATEYGLAIPRGMLIAGISGTGKSLIAKVVAHLFKLPLYRWDIGKLFGSLVGSTEKQTREAFKLIESVSPAVFYIDEIEKSLAGAESSSYTDSGVTARVVGALLTFMQEKTCPAFFAATANSVNKLSPELLRRFNGVWFVDLPSLEERTEIFEIHIKKTSRDPKKYKIAELAKRTDRFTGAEIQLAVEEAMYSAFKLGREYNSKDILTAIQNLPRLADTKEEEIRQLRAWAKGRARIANLEKEDERPAWWEETSLILDDETEEKK